MADDALQNWNVTQEDDPFLMSNLYPDDTGLPMTVWVSVKGGARHDVRVKVSTSHGARAALDDMAVVAVRPEPRLIHGDLTARDWKLVGAWVELNREIIVDHWEGRASSAGLFKALKRLPD